MENILKNETNNKKIFYKLFPNYTKEQILEAIDSLSELDKKIIELKYGLNENDAIGITLISQQLNVSISTVSNHIYSTIKKISLTLDNEIIYKYFPKHTKKQVIDVINTLSEPNKKIIELHFGLNENNITSNEEISKILNIKLETIRTNISNIKTKIKSKLGQKENDKSSFFEYFSGYTKEQVLGAISTLNFDNRKTIEERYGLNGNTVTSTAEMASVYNINSKKMSRKIYHIKNLIEQKLKKGIFKRETIFDLFSEYPKEKILETIDRLNEPNKKIIELANGLNGNSMMDYEEIAQILNTNATHVRKQIWSINNQIKTRLQNKLLGTNDIFNYFLDYTKEQVLEAIDTLSVENKKIIELRYGLNNNSVTKEQDIIKILSLNTNRLDARIYSIRDQIAKRLNKIKLNKEKSDKMKIMQKENILDLYPGYSEEQILEALENIPELNKKIIELKYGLNGNNILENKEIAKKLNTEVKIINSRLYMIKQQIKNRLEQSKKDNIEIINFDEEQNNEFEPKEYQTIIQDVKVKEIVGEKDTTLIKNNFDIPENLDFEKHKDQIKMLINMLNNPTEQVILLLRLGFVNNKYYTEEEIAKFLKISEIDVHDIINKSLSNIVGISTLTIQRTESIRNQLEITKKLTNKNN